MLKVSWKDKSLKVTDTAKTIRTSYSVHLIYIHVIIYMRSQRACLCVTVWIMLRRLTLISYRRGVVVGSFLLLVSNLLQIFDHFQLLFAFLLARPKRVRRSYQFNDD